MESIRLGLEWFLTPPHTPFLVGMEKGWFADAGIDFDFFSPDEPFDPVAALQDGRMDLAVTEPIHLARHRGSGTPIVGFARFFHTNGGVMYLKGRGIERPRDMVGARVQDSAAPAPGGLAMVKWMIEADGGTCDLSEFERVDYGFRHTDALAEGKADVATFAFYNFEVIEARHRGFDADFFALKDWGIPDFCQLVLAATGDALETRREALSRVLAVLRRGIDFLHQYPSEARDIFEQRRAIAPDDALAKAIFEATLRCFTFDFSMNPDYYARLENWMLGTGQIECPLDPADYWTNILLS